MRPLFRLLVAATLLLAASTTGRAVDAPYDAQLMRLAEILGSLHYLRHLCGEEDGGWRAQMEALLEAETPSEERREKLVASFNRGYRSFAAVYEDCTDSARQSIERYMREGEALTSDIVLRYGG